mmetsp:Transcript_111400/g.280203  ORF Transcript_111400/g.280203 Transcript_111400/m.280203 type:complete len:229 (+) Transcript_111400:248-934(+)
MGMASSVSASAPASPPSPLPPPPPLEAEAAAAPAAATVAVGAEGPTPFATPPAAASTGCCTPGFNGAAAAYTSEMPEASTGCRIFSLRSSRSRRRRFRVAAAGSADASGGLGKGGSAVTGVSGRLSGPLMISINCPRVCFASVRYWRACCSKAVISLIKWLCLALVEGSSSAAGPCSEICDSEAVSSASSPRCDSAAVVSRACMASKLRQSSSHFASAGLAFASAFKP